MKKIGLYLIIFILIILLRENICFFYGNILGVFKLDNNYYDGIIRLKDEKISYLEKELNELTDFSEFLKKVSYTYKVSKVLYKESYNLGEYNIQYGTDDDVTLGMGVINESGFVGKISEVNKKSCKLTTLKELKDTSVMVNESYGKLNYDTKSKTFIISDISNYDKVYINDKVYTSGYGSIKEKLYIGKVVKIETSDYEKRVVVESSVDFNNLNYLLIVGEFNDNNS